MQAELLTHAATSGLFHTCHTVVGMIPAGSLPRIGEGNVLLTGPDPFQVGDSVEVPFTEALVKITQPSCRS